jgi:hypothetical protein
MRLERTKPAQALHISTRLWRAQVAGRRGANLPDERNGSSCTSAVADEWSAGSQPVCR